MKVRILERKYEAGEWCPVACIFDGNEELWRAVMARVTYQPLPGLTSIDSLTLSDLRRSSHLFRLSEVREVADDVDPLSLIGAEKPDRLEDGVLTREPATAREGE